MLVVHPSVADRLHDVRLLVTGSDPADSEGGEPD